MISSQDERDDRIAPAFGGVFEIHANSSQERKSLNLTASQVKSVSIQVPDLQGEQVRLLS